MFVGDKYYYLSMDNNPTVSFIINTSNTYVKVIDIEVYNECVQYWGWPIHDFNNYYKKDL